MSNRMNAEQMLRFAARIYKQNIEPLEKSLKRAIKCGFPADHIHRLEQLIAESKAIAGLEDAVIPVPKRSPGRPRVGAPTVQDLCSIIYNMVCPRFIPLKVQIEKGVDSSGKTKPVEGLTFNFGKAA